MQVLLTSNSTLGTEVLQPLLRRSGHVVLEPTVLGAGARLASTSWDVQAALAVFFAARPPRIRQMATLVELGIVLGRELPTLIIARPGLELAALEGISRIDADPSDAETLELKVGLFLDSVQSGLPRRLETQPSV